jgi:hypothetical protein
MQIDDLLKLHGEIDDTLLVWKNDLALKHTIENPELIAHIERVGVPVYERGRSSARGWPPIRQTHKTCTTNVLHQAEGREREAQPPD